MIYRLYEEYDYTNDPYKVKDTKHTGYWYKTSHGIGPGTIPKGVSILDVVEDKESWNTYIELDTAIMHEDELKYELTPKKPNNLKEELYDYDEFDEEDTEENEFAEELATEVVTFSYRNFPEVSFLGESNLSNGDIILIFDNTTEDWKNSLQLEYQDKIIFGETKYKYAPEQRARAAIRIRHDLKD